MTMRLKIIRLRIWRRIRRNYLSMDEMQMLTDLTVTEAMMILRLVEGWGKLGVK